MAPSPTMPSVAAVQIEDIVAEEAELLGLLPLAIEHIVAVGKHVAS